MSGPGTVVLVHGGFVDGSGWQEVYRLLKNDGSGEPALDLATDGPAEAGDIGRYAARRLSHLPDGRETVAAKVVAMGKGNFLYARYVLDELVQQPDLDPQALDLPEGLEGHYRRFLERELARTDEEWKRYRPLLGLLAIARGEGLTPLLLRATSLSRSEADDVIRVLEQYLAGRVPDGPFRLYHQSFRDFLLENDARSLDAAEAEGLLATFLLDEYGAKWHGERSFERSYALAHLPVHLAAAIVGAELRREQEALGQRLSALLSDLGFLESKAAQLGIDPLLVDLRTAGELLPDDERLPQGAARARPRGP